MHALSATARLFACGLRLLVAAACAPRAGTGEAEPAVPPAVDIARPFASPGALQTHCTVASDCAVKNVGNCCGYFPACVNKDSPVDPDAVRAECERNGTSSVCGWKDIQACECTQGQCRAVDGPLPVER